MIETISLNAREIDLSINAESRTLPEERRPWLYVNKQLGAVRKKYYLESEGFIFFDEARAISVAAQLVQWIQTDIRPGRHYIFLPFDNVVYAGTIRVQADYILVEKEDLLPFEDCLQRVRNNPLECQVAELGRLSNAFVQHNIALKDLHINLEPGNNNPFLLRRGYNLVELSLAATVPFIGAGLIFLVASTVNVEDIKETTVKPPPVKPTSATQIDTDLDAVAALLVEFSALLAYDLENIHVQKTPQGYTAGASGRYRQSFSLARLEQIARQLQGRFYLQKNGWTLNSSRFSPPPGEPAELLPLPLSFEQYRLFASANQARFSVLGTTRKRDAARGVVELSVDYPNPRRLRQWARQLRQRALHGSIQKLEIRTQENGAWKNLNVTIEITGS